MRISAGAALLVALVALLLASTALAQRGGQTSCSLGTTGVAFGAYDVFSTAPLDSTGTMTVSCSSRTNITITLDHGGASTFDRRMVNSQQLLSYNLYIDVARSGIWGDGTGTTAVVTANTSSLTRTVYGRIPARQDVKSNNGSLYTDAIVATVAF
jgi:spore coat protein U-like protein